MQQSRNKRHESSIESGWEMTEIPPSSDVTAKNTTVPFLTGKASVKHPDCVVGRRRKAISCCNYPLKIEGKFVQDFGG